MKKRTQLKWRTEMDKKRELKGRLEMVPLSNLHMKPGLEVPVDETFLDLMERVHRRDGSVEVARVTVRVADLIPHDPPSVDRVRLFLTNEEPSLLARAAELVRRKERFNLYVDGAGRLVMCDDYPLYIAAKELGIEEVDAVIYRRS